MILTNLYNYIILDESLHIILVFCCCFFVLTRVFTLPDLTARGKIQPSRVNTRGNTKKHNMDYNVFSTCHHCLSFETLSLAMIFQFEVGLNTSYCRFLIGLIYWIKKFYFKRLGPILNSGLGGLGQFTFVHKKIDSLWNM